jgi:hypothetical protein
MLANKVKLHGLERLDIVDAIDFQNLDNDFTSLVNSGLTGVCEGVTNDLGITYANQTTDIIRFGAFKYVISSAKDNTRELSQIPQGQIVDVVGVSSTDEYNYVSVVNYNPLDEQNTIDVSFDAVKADVQNYYNTNDVLPPQPGSVDFVLETHTRYYPEVLARPFFYDAEQNNRRFWSVANQTEQTQLVATRRKVASEIILNPSHLKPQIAVGEELPWVKVGQITSWSVTGGVVSLVLNKVRPFHVLDSMMKLNAESIDDWAFNTVEANTDGIISKLAHKIDEQLKRILYTGSEDSTEHTVGSAYAAPQYSLSELANKLSALETSAPQLIATATLFFDATVGYNSGTGNSYPFTLVGPLSTNISQVTTAPTGIQLPFSSGSINVSEGGLHYIVLPADISSQYKIMSCTFTAAPANQDWTQYPIHANYNYRQMRQIQDSTFPLIWGATPAVSSLTTTFNDGRKGIKFYCAATDPLNEEAGNNQNQQDPSIVNWESNAVQTDGYLGNGLRQFSLIVNIFGIKL